MKHITKLFLLLCILVLLVIGIVLECKFFVVVNDRYDKQRHLKTFVESSFISDNNNIYVYQMSSSILMFKINNSISINDMEYIVKQYELYCDSNEDADFIRRIVFLDENIQDMLMPRRGNCVIEFARKGNSSFDVINIYDIDADYYPFLCDFTTYQSLSRRYKFDIFMDMIFDEDDDFEVIDSIFFSPQTYCEGVSYLKDADVIIDDNRGDYDY